MTDLRSHRLVAAQGLIELLGAVAAAPRDPGFRATLERVWGAQPWAVLGIVGLGSAAVGAAAGWLGRGLPVDPTRIVAVVAFSLVVAWRLRHLVTGPSRIEGEAGVLFPRLAVPVVAAGTVTALSGSAWSLAEAGLGLAPWPVAWDEPAAAFRNGLAFGLGTLATGAGLAACTATFVGRSPRRWPATLGRLAWRYVGFRIALMVLFFVLALMTPVALRVVARVVTGALDLHVPRAWLVAGDALVDAAILAVILLAIVGASWLVTLRSFPRLVRTGDVDVLGRLSAELGEDGGARREDVELEAKAGGDTAGGRTRGAPPPLPDA